MIKTFFSLVQGYSLKFMADLSFSGKMRGRKKEKKMSYHKARLGIKEGDLSIVKEHLPNVTRNEAQSLMYFAFAEKQLGIFETIADALFSDKKKKSAMTQKMMDEAITDNDILFVKQFFSWFEGNDLLVSKFLCTSITQSSIDCFEFMLGKTSETAKATALMQALRLDSNHFDGVESLYVFLQSIGMQDALSDEKEKKKKMPSSFFINRLTPLLSDKTVEDVTVAHVQFMGSTIRENWEGFDSFILSLNDDVFQKVYNRIPISLRDEIPAVKVMRTRQLMNVDLLSRFENATETKSKRM